MLAKIYITLLYCYRIANTESELLLYWPLMYTVLIGFLNCPRIDCSSVVLKSPVLHDFGRWGTWDECPKGTYATGFQLKTESTFAEEEINCTNIDRYTQSCPHQYKDQTDLNGIRLICAKIGENTASEHKPTSLVGEYGEWGSEFYCDIGTIVGFQLKSATFLKNTPESSQYLGLRRDNVGAINLKTFCVVQDNRMFWLEGEGTDLLLYQWGSRALPSEDDKREYTKPQMCGKRQAITAIRTQVDVRKKAKWMLDVQGLVNIEMRCDDIVDSISTCNVEVIYQPLLECNNIKGTTPIDCQYSVKTGVETTETKSKSTSSKTNIMASLGFSIEYNAVVASGKFAASTTWATETGGAQDAVSSTFFNTEKTETVVMTVPENAIGRLFQVVGYCGDFDARSVEILTDQRMGDLPDPIPKTGFICPKPRPGEIGMRRRNITDETLPRRVKRGRISKEREL